MVDDQPELIPVVLIAGFAHSGKTAVMTSLLTALRSDKRIAVLCNSANDIPQFRGLCEKVVAPSDNVCMCCTGRSEFVTSITELCKSGSYDAILVECTDAASPLMVAETFVFDSSGKILSGVNGDGTLPSGGLGDLARVATIITCVECATAFDHLSSISTCCVDDDDDRDIAEVLLDSIEVASCLVLTMQMRRQDLQRIRDVAGWLNPNTNIIECVDGIIESPEDIASAALSGTFDFARHMGKPVWMLDALAEEAAAAAEKEHTMIYRAGRPFHALRFGKFIDEFFVWDLRKCENLDTVPEEEEEEAADNENDENDDDKVQERVFTLRTERFGQLLRMKGIAWITDDPEKQIEISSAVSMMWLMPGQPWLYDFTDADWEEAEKEFSPADVAEARRQVTLNGVWGDRRQELVFVGGGLKKDEIRRTLDSCLLTDEEMKVPSSQWSKFGAIADLLQPSGSTCCSHHADSDHLHDCTANRGG